jgi:hypothetical protein
MTTTATRPDAGRARAAITAKTLRTDRWWIPPLVTFLGLSAWVAYATVRVFMHNHYFVEAYHYLTPFYSPCITDRCVPAAAHFGTPLPSWWVIPEASFTLPFLLLFRLTCYYYRKAYYRAFWLLGQNLHRYAFYAAVLISLINTYDAIIAFHSPEGFGFGLGNIVLLINVIMLWAYTASCHSCRHIIGGRMKHFSKHPIRYRLWGYVSKLNAKHMQLAWITLGTLALTDFYIMALDIGWFSDLRFIN